MREIFQTRELQKAGLSEELVRLAEKRASNYAAPPKFTPTQAGIIGALIGLLAITLFSKVVGVGLDYFSIASAANLAAFTGLPAAYAAHLRNKHDEAVMREASY